MSVGFSLFILFSMIAVFLRRHVHHIFVLSAYLAFDVLRVCGWGFVCDHCDVINRECSVRETYGGVVAVWCSDFCVCPLAAMSSLVDRRLLAAADL